MKKKVCFQLGMIAPVLVIMYFAICILLEFDKFTLFEAIVSILNIGISGFSIWNINQKKDYVF